MNLPDSLNGFGLKISFNITKACRYSPHHPYRYEWDINFRNAEFEKLGRVPFGVRPDYEMRHWKKYDYSKLTGEQI